MATNRPVLIVGGGVGGLVLAHALQNRGIPFRIFERDPSLTHRAQGYRFHLQPDGLEALFACLSQETIEKLKQSSPHHRGPENGRTCDPHTGDPDEEMAKLAPKYEPGKKPFNVDRGTLRQVLSEAVQLEYGKKYESYAVESDGVTVNFHDGTSAQGSLLVGADGIRSHVREALLPDYTLLDTEGRWIWGKSDLTAELKQKLLPGVDSGIVGARDHQNGSDLPISLIAESIVFERSPDNPRHDLLPPDYIYWVLQFAKKSVRVDDATFFSLDSEGAAARALELTKDWIPGLRAIFEHRSPGTVVGQAVTAGDPTVPSYDGRGRVTLLGDAIHSMPPTAGAGATSAIQDAEWLADAIAEGGISEESLAVYEEKMQRNGRAAIASSELKSTKMFGAPSFVNMRRVRPDVSLAARSKSQDAA